MAGIDFGALRTLGEVGFTGGRDGLRPFAERIFSNEEPRFLRTDDGELVVFRNRDLLRLGAMPEIGNVPPAVLFGAAAYPSDGGEPLVGAELARVIKNQVFTANDPIHKPVRKALVSRLGPKQTKAMKPIAQKVVDRILSEIDINGPVDVVEDIAEKLTCGFWGGVLDMTDNEIVAMQHHTQGLTRLFYFDRKPEDYIAIDEAAKHYREVIVEAVRRCVGRGDNEFVSMMAADLAQIHFEDDLEEAGVVPRDVAEMIAGNLFDGFHTAALGASNTVYTLASRPDIFAEIVASPDLVPNAIFESLRMEPPVIMLKRWVLKDVEYDGYLLPRGTIIAMVWGLSGYDPTVIRDPMRFDLSRSRQASTTFGMGLHICPGRYVAIMLVETLVESLLARRFAFQSADKAEWYPAHAMSQLRTFPLQLTAAD